MLNIFLIYLSRLMKKNEDTLGACVRKMKER